MSSLNPRAAPYVPLSQREAEKVTSGTEKGSENRDGKTLLDSSTSSEKMPEASQTKSNPASDSYGSSSQNVRELTDNQLLDEDMDIEYLKMTFPGVSEQSLRDVYAVNEEDLYAAVDMLTQLEDDVEYSVSLPETLGIGDVQQSSVNLPETLGIGDVSESESSADSGSLKPKNVAAEASTSSNPSAPSDRHK